MFFCCCVKHSLATKLCFSFSVFPPSLKTATFEFYHLPFCPSRRDVKKQIQAAVALLLLDLAHSTMEGKGCNLWSSRFCQTVTPISFTYVGNSCSPTTSGRQKMLTHEAGRRKGAVTDQRILMVV